MEDFSVKLRVVSLLFLIAGLSHIPIQPQEATTDFSLKDLHETLFDLYFPENDQLSTAEKRQRFAWREQMWGYLQTQPEILQLLTLLQPSSSLLPDDLKNQFSDIIDHHSNVTSINKRRIEDLQRTLRNHPDNNIRKFAAMLRKIYSYLAYSNAVTLKISGYNCQQTPELIAQALKKTPLKIHSTKLRFTKGNIEHTQGSIDYLIIGSGPAGSLIAYELLCQKPNARVVLIDSGSLVKPHSVITESSSEFMESNNTRTSTDGSIALRNARAFGGGTIVNLDLAFSPLLPQIKHQISSWIDAGMIDGSLIHNRTTKDYGVLKQAYNYVTKHIGTRMVNEDEVNANNKILLRGAPTATTYNLNARKPLSTKDKNLKISALEAFIQPALRKGLSIIPDLKVKKLLFEDTHYSHATGVIVELQHALNQPYTITDPNGFNLPEGTLATINAKNIIICAGTLGSAELLLRSKVPNNNIGKGIVLHPSIGMYGRFDHEVDVLNGLSASVYASAPDINDGYFFESMSADPAFMALINFGSGKQILDIIRDVKYLGGFGIMLIDTPHPDNKVFIDPFTDTVQVHYTLHENDKARLRKGLIRGLEMLFEQGAYEVHMPTSEQILGTTQGYIPFTAKEQVAPAIAQLQFKENQNFISSAHMQGSNKMGNDPITSVVSPRFKVWNQKTQQEIANLYVCDSSIFPTSVGANPMQSIYTFAKLFVDQHIKTLNQSMYLKCMGYLQRLYGRLF